MIINKQKNYSNRYIKQLETASSIAIIGHINPDADAIGAAIALKRLIKQNLETEDKSYQIDLFFDTNAFDSKYWPLIKGEEFNTHTKKKYDLAIALDSPNRERLGKYDKVFKKASNTLNIDHHETNSKFAKTNIVAYKCSSTCEILALLCKNVFKWKANPDIFSLLYSGIITDTNNLTQGLGFKTLKVISGLMIESSKQGKNLNKLRDYFFKNNTKEQMALLSHALNGISFTENNEIAVMKITKQDFLETNTSMADTLGIVDYAVKLQGVKVGVLFIKQDDNSYYVSLRSRENLDIANIAKQMGGGGHQSIAAFSTKPNESLTDVKIKLYSLCKKQILGFTENVDLDSFFLDINNNNLKDNDNLCKQNSDTSIDNNKDTVNN